ncbi:MAG TPA: type VI secretion system accessory protein TagJ [Pirellulaceae bacterium]|nr:type VI secretion system accessory protein TagJ [Pirellulaceae bacterium]
MSADELLRDGKLDEALAALTQQVRAKPADAKLRTFLFQLLCVQGQWERALNQLNVAGEMDAGTLAMVNTYREALRCELLRAEIFAGKRSPLVFGQPAEWVAQLIQALSLTAAGKHSAAAELRERAFEAAPATSGVIATARPGANDSRVPPVEATFQWLADADSRLGPVIEAVFSGKYYWVPLVNVRRIDVEPPSDLRDVVWMPAHFVWPNGGDTVALIPTRYAGSEANGDPLIRLARKSDWNEAAPGVFLGQGQRMLATDAGEYPLMDVRQIRFDVPLTDGPLAAAGEGAAEEHG